MKQVVIVGMGDYGKEIKEYLQDPSMLGAFSFKGFLGFPEDQTNDPLYLGSIETYSLEENDYLIIAVGNPQLREKLTTQVVQKFGEDRFCTLIHRTAYVSKSAHVSPGCIIGPFAHIGHNAYLDRHVVLNIYSSAAHNTKIGKYSVLSPYATINGHVCLGNKVLLGTHSHVYPNITIGTCSKIAAGSVIAHDLAPGTLATGNPAKSRVMFAVD